MRNIKALGYVCGFAFTTVGLGLYSYYIRDLLASLLLFSAVFLALATIVLSVILAWYATMQVTLWSWLASRKAIASTVAGGTTLLVIGAKKKV